MLEPGLAATEFQERLRLASPAQVEQCMRLLGLYLALYKRRFGELDERACQQMLGAAPDDMALAEFMAEGLEEVNAMLSLLHAEHQDAAGPGTLDVPLRVN